MVNQELYYHSCYWAGHSLGWKEQRWRFMNNKPWVLTFSPWVGLTHLFNGLETSSESCLAAARAPSTWRLALFLDFSCVYLDGLCWKHVLDIHLLPRTASVQELWLPCKHHPFRYDFRPCLQGHCLQPHSLSTAMVQGMSFPQATV